MVAPAPKSESISLANEAKDLPLDAAERRRALAWRLRNLVRKNPNDEAARLGLMFAAFHSGDRNAGVEELYWLAGRYRSLDTAVLTNIVAPLVMVGDLQRAATILAILADRPERPHLDGAKPGQDVLYALMCGCEALARALAANSAEGEAFLRSLLTRGPGGSGGGFGNDGLAGQDAPDGSKRAQAV